MSQGIPHDSLIYADTGEQIGTVVNEKLADEVGVLTTEGQRIRLPRYALQYRGDRWVIEGDYRELSSPDPQGNDLDEASKESFPASDPPAFTMGDEGKGS